MRKLFILLLITCIAQAQSISKQVIGAAGKTQTVVNSKLSWTLGEPVVGLMTAGGKQLSNGYYPALNLQALSIEDIDMYVQIKLYPNPTSQALYVSHPELNSFIIMIVDLNGKQVYAGTIYKEEPLDVSNYTKGMYIVTIEDKTSNKKNTFKIIKN
jgi:hypothetical protein